MFGNNLRLAANMNLPPEIFFLFFVFLVFVIFITLYVMNKLQIISALRKKNEKLTASLERLDHQAKLILKNDMDLKLYQQEIEEPNSKINLIRKFIFSTLHMLDKENLFSKINPEFIEDFGVKKSLILDFADFNQLHQNGFNSEEIKFIKSVISQKKYLFKEKRILTAHNEACSKIASKLNNKNILIAPIKTKNKIYGIFIVAELINLDSIKEYTKESLLVICMYLAKCLESIDLFEQVYRTKEELENKIKTRTKELAVSLKKVETISKTKSDFISSVSHELRTPLTSVKGFSSLLATEKFGKLPAEAKIRLNKVVENVDKLMDIVNTLLDISRIESGKIEVNIIPHDAVSLVKDVADFFEPQSREKKISIDLENPENLIAYMDKNLIERVLINLLNNALKFTPPGGKIKITCQEKGEKVIISMADTGYGISEDNLTKIFQEFYRVKDIEKKAIKGSGLGLSLVKRIIDGHKEKIWVESKVGKGTTFYFSLPKKKDG